MGTIQRMAHHAAFYVGKDGLQRLVLLDQFLLVGSLLGHIDGHAYRSHNAAVKVIQRRFIGH